jgi:heme oxygenase (mycobilin-producing)
MIAVSNRLYVTPEHAATLEERFRSRSGLIDDMPGFILNQVLRPMKEGDPYIIVTLWDSYEHFEMWKKSDAFKQAHAQGLPEGASTGPNHVEMHEVIMDTSRPELHG